jgi:uncharacterized CHY-type Zn-finger protein
MSDLKSIVKNYLSYQQLKVSIQKMRMFWKNIPEQVRRITIIIILVLASLIIVRNLLIPVDFGEYGHYRSSAVEEIISQEIKFAGQDICFDCHDDIVNTKTSGFHTNVACEVCHGPAAGHTEDPESVQLKAPRERGYCPLCHEYLPSRPTGFPQIIAASHNPMNPCISCHDPHDPEPPEIPKECSACHAEIATTKSLSHHVYVPCMRCHETPDEHKIRPREITPAIPETRAFCGSCHAEDAPSQKGIPRINLETHETRYVCWQCHYPHLPEAR